MSFPLHLSFRNMAPSAAIEEVIRQKARKLDVFTDHILWCRVVVERVGNLRQHGSLYELRIDLATPGQEIVVQRELKRDSENKDFHVEIREAFDSARRQLEAHAHRRRRDVKTHEEAPHGKVSQLFPDEDYGFLETMEGREIYFHRHSLVNGDFDHLEVGREVAFVEQEGTQGPQASTVRIIGRH
jgi:cold shock CspA family protein